jgi:hypothetical protein
MHKRAPVLSVHTEHTESFTLSFWTPFPLSFLFKFLVITRHGRFFPRSHHEHDTVDIHEDGSNNELDFYYTGYHISSRTASSLPELLQAPSNGYNLLAPVSVIDYVPTLDYGSSVFPHQAQQDLSHTVFRCVSGSMVRYHSSSRHARSRVEHVP